MTIYKRIIVLSFLVASLSACGTNATRDTNNSTETLSSSNLEQVIIDKEISLYEEVLESANVQKISLSEVKNIGKSSVNSELVYFGRSTCVYCRKLMIENGEALKDSSLKILYVDTDLLSSEEKEVLATYQITEVPSFIEVNGSSNYTKVELEEFERRIHNE